MGAEPDLLWVKGERSRRFRFGIFELDPRGGELWKAGVRTRLQPQPARVLTLLVSRAGDLVTREEIQREVWHEGTFVDFGVWIKDKTQALDLFNSGFFGKGGTAQIRDFE